MIAKPASTQRVEIKAFEDLTGTDLRRWEDIYQRAGVCVHQSPAYAGAMRDAGNRVIVATGRDVVAAFTCEETVCTAIGGDEPLLGTSCPGPARLAAVAVAVGAYTDLPVYLPLVDSRYAEIARQNEFACWRRPPNSVIDWAQGGQDLLDRVQNRGTSHLERKRRLVERDGLRLDIETTGEAAVTDLLTVEDRSWKAARGQSMRRRGGQAWVYGTLLRRGFLSVSFLRDGDRPVAFRLEARIRDRLTCLKWSYDDSYKRYSPGVYLLTEGLVRQWGETGLRVVDLFGGPDTLKNLLYTHRVPRVDVWCGDAARGAERARERHALDERVDRVHQANRGLRHACE